MTIIVPYSPRQYQIENLHNVEARFKVLVWHRWSGKTTSWLAELLKQACIKKWTYHFISPTYTQSKRNAWKIIKEMSVVIPWTNFNESELKITLPNWSLIYLLGADNPDSLRGLDYCGVVMDEYSQQPGNIFTEIIRPRLAITNWRCIWIWTPKWQNSFFDLYEWATNDGWHRSLLTYKDTWIIKDEEILAMKKDMSTDEFEQEMNCSFTASIKWAYYWEYISKCREDWRVTEWIYDKALPVNTYWDLWISDYTSIIFVQVHRNQVRIIDSYQNNWQWLEHYFKYLQDKNYSYEYHYFPHDISVKELWTWITRLELAEKFFWSSKCRITPNVLVKDGIEAVKYIFEKLWFEKETTKWLLDAISQYTQERDDKKWMFKDNPRHDWTSHYADSLRYLAVNYRDLIKKNQRDTVISIDFSKYV